MNPQAPGADEVVTLRRFIALFTAVMLPIFLAAIDQTLLATATPAIARDLGGLRDSAWIAVAYLLASTIMAPLYGRLGDRYGRRDALLAALGVFALGSAACAAAGAMGWLVAARLLQGLGGGGLMVMSQALIGEVVPPGQRARFQVYFGAVFVLSSVLGPVLGGIVVVRWSWRWLFAANLPLAAVAAWRVLSLEPGIPPPPPGQGHDVPGVMLFAMTAACALLWLSLGGHRFAWLSGTSALLATVTLGAGALLLRRERRQQHPFLPVELLRMPPIAWMAATVVLFAAGMFALVFFLPVYVQLGRHGDAAHAGLLLLPLTVGLVLGANVTGRVMTRTRRLDLPPRFGLALSAAAILALGLVHAGAATVAVLAALAGLGFGTVMPSSQILVQTVAGRSRLGAAAATVSLARSTGAALGTAVFGALVYGLITTADLQAALHGTDAAATARVTHAFHLSFIAAGGLTAFAAWVASRIPRIGAGAQGAQG